MEENLWYYVPVIQDYNNYDAAHMMEEYFYEHTGEKIQVNTERVFSVDFADYKNEMFNFYFHYRNNGTLNLAYRDSEAYYSSRSLAYESLYSGGIVVIEDENIEERFKMVLDSIISKGSKLKD